MRKVKKKYFKESDKLGGKDIYSGSKAAAEILCDSYFHSFLKSKSIYLDTARAGNIIGGGDFGKDRLVPDIIRSINSKKKFHVRSPNSIRPWQHIFDVCFGYMLIPINQQKRNSLKMSWNFGPDKRESKYKVSKIVKLFKKNKKTRNVVSFVMKLPAPLAPKTAPEEPPPNIPLASPLPFCINMKKIIRIDKTTAETIKIV